MINKALILLFLLFTNFAFAQNANTPPSFNIENYFFQTSDNKKHQFSLEVALSNEQQAYGLMFRRSLNLYNGMIFFWGRMQKTSMWMKNTYISLDMIFFDDKGVIVDIIPNAVPLSENTISPKAENFGVVELNAGVAKKINLKIGDKILGARL